MQIFHQAALAAWLLFLLGGLFIVYMFSSGKPDRCSFASRIVCVLAALTMGVGVYFGNPFEDVDFHADIPLLIAFALYFYFLFSSLSRFPWQTFFPRQARPGKAKPTQIIFLAAVLLFVLAILYKPFFPYRQSPDTVNQWKQIHGLLQYNKIHAIGHTIFLKAILSVWDNYTCVIIVHILSIILLYLLFAAYFLSKGMNIKTIAFIYGLSLLWTRQSTFAFFYPWKDLPASVCIGLITFFIVYFQDKKSLTAAEAFFLGLALAWCALFRLNGIIAAVICGLVFSVLLWRRALFRQLCAMALAIVLSVAGVAAYSSLVLKPADYENGFSIQVFGSGIAAVAANDHLLPKEEADISAYLPLEWMQAHYPSFLEKKELIWEPDESEQIMQDPELSIFNNEFVMKLGENKKEVILLYLRLLPRHFPTMLKDIAGSVKMVWILDDPFFPCCHSFLVMALLVLLVRSRLHFRDMLIFLPCLCNTVSIMISTITNEIRYLLPTFLLFPIFLCFLLYKEETLA